jgi:hypothetical protein
MIVPVGIMGEQHHTLKPHNWMELCGVAALFVMKELILDRLDGCHRLPDMITGEGSVLLLGTEPKFSSLYPVT